MKQSDVVLETEGDAWFERNKDADRANDPVLQEIFGNPKIKPSSVLEIGCGTGWRLQRLLAEHREASFSGCDLSWEAIQYGRTKYPKIALRRGAANSIGYADSSFDVVILGFFLYLADREDLFRIVAEADRVLMDGGALIVHDFTTGQPHSAAYKHDERLLTYKMNYSALWLGNPAYKAERIHYVNGESVATLRKNIKAAWPRKS